MTIHMKNLERLSLADAGIRPGQPEVNLVPRRSSSHLWFYRGSAEGPAVPRLSRGQRGVVRRFLTKVSGLSRAQITRLIAAWMRTRQVRRRPPQRPNFPRRYSSADVVLLAEVDAAHEELSGPATRHILEREFSVFGKAE